MIDSKLRYVGTVAILVGFGISSLTVIRGLSPTILDLQFGGLSGNSTLQLFLPPTWPPRNVRMAPYLRNGTEVVIMIFNESNYVLFSESKGATPLKEDQLGGGTVQFEIPARGRYYIVLRNKGSSTLEGGIILTFWGFERDLVSLSMASFAIGVVFWIIGHLFENRKRYPKQDSAKI